MAPRKKPTVMVTGAAGALARQVIRRLRERVNIVAVDFRRRVRIDSKTPTYQGDPTRRDFEDVFRNHDISAVIHLGRMESDEMNAERRYNANVLGTQRLFRLCSQYGVQQIIVMSTFYVYGASPYNPALLGEDAPLKASGLTMDLIDSVELENLAAVALWKHPELHLTVLRPCHIAGPRVRNTMSTLLDRQIAPVLAGFSPMMQFIHVSDMARAIVMSFEQNNPGIYNVAPSEWLSYQDALRACGCAGVPVPSIPPAVPALISRLLRGRAFPRYLINYLKYPVLIDGSHFNEVFGFECEQRLDDILAYYRQRKHPTD
ncbi:MAG: NAD-dependent epimerase/dehydratase family protein [Gammaproteobacteria bacterium]